MRKISGIITAAVTAALLAAALPASAETKRHVRYPYDWTYSSAIRLLKVDLKSKLEEEDRKLGYILFWYEYNGIKSFASMEFVDVSSEEDGYDINVRLVLEKLPSWVEDDILDKLEDKIKDQYGSPPEFKKKKKPEKEKKDEGEHDKKEEKKDKDSSPSD